MARLDVSNIDMNEIHVKVGGTSSTQVSMNDTDVRGMAAPDPTYAGNDGLNTANNSTIAIGEYRNGEHTSIDSFFSLNSWSTFQTDSVANNSFGTAQAFAQMAFRDLKDSNTGGGKIECVYYAGDTSAFATTYTSYINYTGFTGNINVKYITSGTVYANVNDGNYNYHPHGWPGHASNPAISGTMLYTNSRARKVSGTNYLIPTSGYVPFKWFVEGPSRGSGGSPNQGFDHVQHTVGFTISFVSDSVTYSANSVARRIELMAGRGPLIL